MHCAPGLHRTVFCLRSLANITSIPPLLFLSILYLRDYIERAFSLVCLAMFSSSRDFSFRLGFWIFLIFLHCFPFFLSSSLSIVPLFSSFPTLPFSFLLHGKRLTFKKNKCVKYCEKEADRRRLYAAVTPLLPCISLTSQRRSLQAREAWYPFLLAPFFLVSFTLSFFLLYCVRTFPGNVFSVSDVGRYSAGFPNDPRTVPARIGLTVGRLSALLRASCYTFFNLIHGMAHRS